MHRNVELFREFASYGRWANALLVERAMALPEELLDRSVPGSFPTLRATFLHIRDAECMWYLRLSGGTPRWPAGPGRELHEVLEHAEALERYVHGLTADELQAEVTYTNLKGEPFTQQRWRPLLHCLNHSTYHRGQVVSTFHGLGVVDIPNTDLVRYQRSLLA